MDLNKSTSNRVVWPVGAVLAVAVIVGLAVGLGIGLQKRTTDTKTAPQTDHPPACADESTARIPSSSPIYTPPTTTKEGKYRFLAVAADSTPCSAVGTRIMVQQGGTAVDAAIAAMLCLGVTHPQGSGIGGGHFTVLNNRNTSQVLSVNAREMAPGLATESMFEARNVSSKYGGKAIGIPGEVLGLHEAWKLGGKLPWATLFKPAIKMARSGFKVDKLLAEVIQSVKESYNEYTELRDMVTNGVTGDYYQEGEIMRLPKLAATLEAVAEGGPDVFYRGSLAANIVADIQEAGGILTMDDMARYQAVVKEPMGLDLHNGYKMFTPPPPSSGAVTLLILNILNGFNLTEESFSTVEKTVLTYHRILEAFKHGFAVRSRLGDVDVESDAFKQEMAELLSKIVDPAFGTEKRQKIDDDKTFNTAYYQQAFYTPEDSGTSHLSVLDPRGDAVSVTGTLNLYFGSKVVGRRTGIVFNNQMAVFSTPGNPNQWGISPSPANFIKPFKRPLSGISPVLVQDQDGEVKLVTGASGGLRIITSTAMSLIQTLWFNLGLKETLDYPRAHHQLVPPYVRLEQRFPQVLVNGLLAKGHKVRMFPDSLSAVQAILRKGPETIYANCDVTKQGIPDGC